MPAARGGRTIRTEPVDAIQIPSGRWEPAYDDDTGLVTLPAFIELLHRAALRLSRQPRTLGVMVTEVEEVVAASVPPAERKALLLEVTRRLRSAIRVGDVAGRIGNGTFALLCEDLGSLDEAIQIVERLIAVLDQPFEVEGGKLVVRPDFGLCFPVGEDRADLLLQRSLEALHAARANPRLRYDVILGSPDEPRTLLR